MELFLQITKPSTTSEISNHCRCESALPSQFMQVALYFKAIQPVRLVGSYRCWFVKKYCWLVCVREKYCFGWKFTIVYDKPQPNEQADLSFYLCSCSICALCNYQPVQNHQSSCVINFLRACVLLFNFQRMHAFLALTIPIWSYTYSYLLVIE